MNVAQVEALTWKELLTIPFVLLNAGDPQNQVLDLSFPDPTVAFSSKQENIAHNWTPLNCGSSCEKFDEINEIEK